MRSLIDKLDAYMKIIDLEEISDRRFTAILTLYTEIVKQNSKLEDSEQSEDIKAFIDAIENSINS